MAGEGVVALGGIQPGIMIQTLGAEMEMGHFLEKGEVMGGGGTQAAEMLRLGLHQTQKHNTKVAALGILAAEMGAME